MNSEQEYRQDHPHRSRRKKAPWPLIAIPALLIIAAIGYFGLKPEPPAPAVSVQPAPAPTPIQQPFPESVAAAPDIPAEIEPAYTDEEAEPLLPDLGESDPFARNILAALSGDETFNLWLQTDNLIQKVTTVIDGLSRGNILRKILPIQPPEEKFAVIKDADTIWLDENNYRRFDNSVNLFLSISPDAMAQAFHSLRPLFETAYSQLGFPADKFDNAVIAAIDEMLAAPTVTDPIALKSESVAYRFADPTLETLPAVQKQMLRVGPENSAKIKAHLREIRTRLLESSDNQD